MFKNTLIPFALAVTVALAAHANDEDDLLSLYDEEDLITIATGTQKQVRFAPSVATVITAQNIQDLGARSLSEVLESVPGIHVGDALLFDDDLISIRGIQTSNNPQVLVLIDGVEVRHLFTAARPAGFRMPLANVHRIEIIRGPGSAVHGADAFAGVINIITRNGAHIDGAQVGIRYGSFNTQDIWLQTGRAQDQVDWAFSHEYSRTNGDHERQFTVNAPAFGSGDFRSEYEIYNTQLKAEIADWRFRLHNWKLNNGGNGPGGAQVPDPQGTVNSDYYQLDIGHSKQLQDTLNLDVRAGYHRGETKIENMLFPAGFYPVDNEGNPFGVVGGPAFVNFANGIIGNPDGVAKVFDIDVALLSTKFSNHVIRVGAGYVNEDVDTGERKNFGPGVLDTSTNPSQTVPAAPVDISDTQFVFVEDVDREAYHISVQDEWRLSNDWELTWGVRFDEFNDVGSTVNPRLALVWAVDYNLTTKFLYGRAFRAPSFTELFSKNNPSQLGNRNLEPETIDTFEASLNYQINHGMTLLANTFYYQIDDLIDFVPSASVLQAQNAIDQEGYGVELNFSWKISEALALHSNAAIQKLKNKDSNQDIADVPRQQLFAGLQWRPDRSLHLGGELHWIGERKRASGDPRADADEYMVFNLSARKSLANSGLQIGAAVKNLFDEDGVEPAEFGVLYASSDYPI
ncbi:MAG: TonB-dependent receptor, partial [Gammaproteobacteria bacterium]|nr:TonB-dependent receptor [Gammaproteobacteria bacterium]